MIGLRSLNRGSSGTERLFAEVARARWTPVARQDVSQQRGSIRGYNIVEGVVEDRGREQAPE